MNRITRPFFRYVAQWRRKRDEQHNLKEAQKFWQDLLEEKLAMSAETVKRPAIRVEKATTKAGADYCVLHPTPSLSGPLRTTDPIAHAHAPKKLLPNPLYVEHDRLLGLLKKHVEMFVQQYGAIPVAIRLSENHANLMEALHYDFYCWQQRYRIPLFRDALSARMDNSYVECIAPVKDGRIPADAPTLTVRPERATKQLRLSDLQGMMEGTR